MRFVLLAIVLAFPVLDLLATVRFARWTGAPVWAWIALSLAAGLYLLHSERLAFRARTVAALHGEEPLFRGLLDSGRKVLAGALLILPGVVSDLAALALLMLPINLGRTFGPQPAAVDRGGARASIDGEYRRID
jgi:UPF0716 protein FxsA